MRIAKRRHASLCDITDDGTVSFSRRLLDPANRSSPFACLGNRLIGLPLPHVARTQMRLESRILLSTTSLAAACRPSHELPPCLSEYPSCRLHAVLGRRSAPARPLSNRIRTSRFRFATVGRPEQDRESHLAAARVAIDTPGDLPYPVHSQRRLPVQPLWHRRLRPTHAPPHAPLPQPVPPHKPPLWLRRATLWLLPWRDRRQFGPASS